MPLKPFACVYRKCCVGGGGGKSVSGKICGEMCHKIKKLSDWNKNWCGSRYGPHDYDSGDKKTKRQKGKKKKTKKQKKEKNTKKTKRLKD